MNKYQQMEFFLHKNHGYLFTSEVEKASISRTYLARFVKENQLEKVAKGIYISPDTWPDELYILQICNPRIVYWGETALYLHGLLDRKYSDIYVSVPPKYNQTRLREQGIIVHQEKQEIYELGIVEIETNFGNRVRTYDKERCICDLVKNRKKVEVQHFQTAMKTFMGDRTKNLSRFLMYGEELKIRDELMKYVEAML